MLKRQEYSSDPLSGPENQGFRWLLARAIFREEVQGLLLEAVKAAGVMIALVTGALTLLHSIWPAVPGPQ